MNNTVTTEQPSDPPVSSMRLLGRVLPLQPGRIVYRELHGPKYRTYGEVTKLSERFVWVLWDGNTAPTRELRRRWRQWYHVTDKRPNGY